MNDLIVLYDNISSSKRLFSQYAYIGKNSLGNKYSFISTNTRGILHKRGEEYKGFYTAYKLIKDVESIPRDQWERTNRAGQSTEKQHTVKMRESEFFMVRNNAFIITSRGHVFEKMVENENLSDIEKRFLTYLLIISSYFSKIPNYIVERTKEVFKAMEEQGITNEKIFKSIKEFIYESQKENFQKKDIFLLDYTYYDSFSFDYDQVKFLTNYDNSTEQVRNEFKKYIYDQQEDASSKKSILKEKYKPGGNYTLTTIVDNAWMLYVTQKLALNSDEINNFESFVTIVVDLYGELFHIDKSEIKKFIFDTDKNKSVFNVIYSQLFNIPIIRYEVEKDLTPEEIEELGRIDGTDELGRLRNEQVVISLKKLAKSHSNYLCECDELEGCKYFTSRENNENFLEIHHLIPREFANDFDESIEVLSNYVALCPNCHRKIHLAVDRERNHLLLSLLNKRQISLQRDGLNIDKKTLFTYYGFK